MNTQQFLFEETKEKDTSVYSKKTQIPHYEPSDVKPSISELCNFKKYSELIRDIKNSSVLDEEKEFLMKAATRHLVFNYSKIADYYAHATPEMQKLMEQSALVIIDMDDAIANGYVKLNKVIKDIMRESGESVKDEE